MIRLNFRTLFLQIIKWMWVQVVVIKTYFLLTRYV